VGESVVARSPDAPRPTDSQPETEFDELRALIVGPEQRELRALVARLDDPGRQARDVSQVLPEAVLLRKDDPHLTRALAPTVEEAITSSVRRNPQPLADALFPVIGPAIRKAIAASLSAMLESVNRTLEHSLSWRAVKWRITALRTGKSFAEIVLLNTLVYRVEQVLLIDRRSGLLLQHVTDGTTPLPDADMVSGMLTAIRDFARDSFKVSEQEALDTLEVGDLKVWIEQGPYAVLAAVVRGTAPLEVRTVLQVAIERLHAYFGDVLRDFKGDTAPLEVTRPTLETCLHAQYRRDEKRSSRLLWAVAAIALIGAGVWLVLAWQDRVRWNRYLDTLRAEPGIVVVSSERRGGRYIVNGLRDPLARDPSALLAEYRLRPDEVDGRWTLYQALSPNLVLARARQVLQAPSGVTLQLNRGLLRASGNAPADWILDSMRLAPALAGVTRYDATEAIRQAIPRLGDELARSPVLFVRGTVVLAPGSERVLTVNVDRIRTLDALARAVNRRLQIEVVGHADSDGPPESNDPLSVRRADRVRAALAGLAMPQIDLTVGGVGSREPTMLGGTDSDKQQNRRVTIHLLAPRDTAREPQS
jgi:outer membrane protein OmpA-like peptidoglycan-associated protein